MEMRRTRRRVLPGGAKRQLIAFVLVLLFSPLGYIESSFWTFWHDPSAATLPAVSPPSFFTLPELSLFTTRGEADLAEPDPYAPTSAPQDEPTVAERLTTAALVVPTARRTPPPPAVDFREPLKLGLDPEPRDRASAAKLVPLQAPEAPVVPAPPVPIVGKVKKGQMALTIFARAGVDAAQVITLRRTIRAAYDIRRLRVGQPYSIQATPNGQLQHFTYEIDSQRRLTVERRNDTFIGRVESIPYQRRERVVSVRINDSIYTALVSRGESPRLVSDFADIFAWKVDFLTDLRQGDTFRLLIEERLREGSPPRYHRILAAELVNKGQVLQAVRFVGKHHTAYYRPDGRSLRGRFLRSPLRYTRISSRFSRRRLHPILKRYRPHWGVDYAAPSGTPVHSVAKGTVRWVGRKGGSGKMIKIRHDSLYMTYYLHLSRYARGMRPGVHVEQGQLIGYVGSTGLSTGPHLDFRLTKKGRYINPMRQKSMEAPPLSKKALPAFRTRAQQLLAKLEQVQAEPRQHVVSIEEKQKPAP